MRTIAILLLTTSCTAQQNAQKSATDGNELRYTFLISGRVAGAQLTAHAPDGSATTKARRAVGSSVTSVRDLGNEMTLLLEIKKSFDEGAPLGSRLAFAEFPARRST